MKEVDHRYQELQQTEAYLRSRVEELESTELSLRDSISEIEQRSSVRERRMVEEMNRLRDECSVRGSNDKLNYEKLSGHDENLKLEYDAIKAKLRDLTCHLEEKCKHFHETESSLRTELCKARSSIATTNKQLSDYDAENCQLKEKLSDFESSLQEKFKEVDSLKNQLEQTNIEHSNILTDKDRQIHDLTSKLDHGDNFDSHLELSELSVNSGGLQSVIGDISNISNSIAPCENCDASAICDKLQEAANQLQTFAQIVCHEPHDSRTSDMYRCISEDNILDIVETGKEEEADRLLESQLAELTEKLDRMETEMCIVSEESSNLQQALEIKESTIADQRLQISELSTLVLTLEKLVPG